MKALLLQGGDLVLGAGGFVTISGAAKTQQDLGITVRELLGSDRFHPRWGSLLDQLIGLPSMEQTRQEVHNEITRLVMNYAVVQAETLARDAAVGRKTRYEAGEVVGDISGIEIIQEYDKYHVRVRVRTLSGEEIGLVRTIK